VLVASTHPDGLEKLAGNIGIASRAKVSLAAPLADYEASLFNSPWLRKATAGLTGLGLIFGACLVFGRYAARKRSGA
jgi:cobalt/nickel transport system permease protein